MIFRSARPTFDKIIVNVDVTVGVMCVMFSSYKPKLPNISLSLPPGPLERICAEYLKVSPRDIHQPTYLGRLRLFLKGVKVLVDIPGHSGGKKAKSIRDVVANVGESTFNKDGERISVGVSTLICISSFLSEHILGALWPCS